MAGEGDPVDVEVLDGNGVVRGQLGGVEHDPGAVGVGGRRELPDGPQLAGDVRGAGDADEGRAVTPLDRHSPGGEGALQGLDGLAGAGRGVEVGDLGVAPGQQGGVVLGLEDEDLATGGERGGEEVQGVGGGAGEHHLVTGPAVEELGDRPAGVLEQVGGQLGQVPGAAVDAAVVRGVGGDVVPDALERRSAGGVVERGVGDLASGDERHGDIPAQNGQRGTNRLVGGERGDGHG